MKEQRFLKVAIRSLIKVTKKECYITYNDLDKVCCAVWLILMDKIVIGSLWSIIFDVGDFY